MQGIGGARQRGVSKLVVILLIVLIVLLLSLGTVAGLYVTGMIGGGESEETAEGEGEDSGDGDGSGDEADEPAPAKYLALEEPIQVNIPREGGGRAILQARLEIMARDEKVFEAVKTHMPVVRNDLIALFGDQDQATVASSEGKQALREQAREAINRVLEAHGEDPAVEAVYFNQLVTQ